MEHALRNDPARMNSQPGGSNRSGMYMDETDAKVHKKNYHNEYYNCVNCIARHTLFVYLGLFVM